MPTAFRLTIHMCPCLREKIRIRRFYLAPAIHTYITDVWISDQWIGEIIITSMHVKEQDDHMERMFLKALHFIRFPMGFTEYSTDCDVCVCYAPTILWLLSYFATFTFFWVKHFLNPRYLNFHLAFDLFLHLPVVPVSRRGSQTCKNRRGARRIIYGFLLKFTEVLKQHWVRFPLTSCHWRGLFVSAKSAQNVNKILLCTLNGKPKHRGTSIISSFPLDKADV